MAQAIHITVVGNLVDAPELRFTPSGAAVAKCRIASTERVFRDAKWEDGETTFIDGTVWRQSAENLAESMVKGQRVIATGILRQSHYETKEGEKRSRFEMTIEEIGASLRYATVSVNKMARKSDKAADGQAAPAGTDPWATDDPNWADREPSF